MDNSDIQTIKRKSNNPNGRPIRVPWRFDSDGNLIIENPTKHDYNINYYKHVESQKLQCNLCGRNTMVKYVKDIKIATFAKNTDVVAIVHLIALLI